MCCGCPVIASDLPGVKTVVSKTNFGYLVKPRDPKDIADKILLIYQGQHSASGFTRDIWEIDRAAKHVSTVFNPSGN